MNERGKQKNKNKIWTEYLWLNHWRNERKYHRQTIESTDQITPGKGLLPTPTPTKVYLLAPFIKKNTFLFLTTI